MQEQEKIKELKDILKRLRDPVTGCPWDRVQTFASIAPNTVEEAYEVQEAIETDNMDGLKEEIGDLLLHVLFYSDIAEEQSIFNFEDVVTALCSKLIERHPHVFGTAPKAGDAVEALASWEKVKAAERKNKKQMKGVLDGVAVTLPASTVAVKLLHRLKRIGVYMPSIQVEERLNELLNNFKLKPTQDNFGKLYFLFMTMAEQTGINPDTALREYNRKFKAEVERLEKDNDNLANLSEQQQKELWWIE